MNAATPEANQPLTVSFDLFDTVLLRPVIRPADIFILVEKDLQRAGWAAARQEAERAARKIAPGGEANLGEIYAARPLAAFSDCLTVAREQELQWESQAIVLPRAAELIAASRHAGTQILFVSDMYLPRAIVEALLREVMQPGDRLYLSHEERCGKGGGLWQKLAKEYPKPWRHYGDNPCSDGSCARAVGIETVAVTDTAPNARELIFARENPTNPFAAGAARLARVLAPANADAAWIDGADIVGPVFYEFTRWVLAKARGKKLEAVYFLARDGELPAAMARLLSAAAPDLSVVYLKGSRHAFYNAAFDLKNAEHREWMIQASPSSIRGILANLKTSPEEQAPWLSAAGFGQATWDMPRSSTAGREFLTQLAATPGADAWNEAHHRLHTAPALAYFNQSGIFQHRRIGLVDIGWAGTTLESFRAILARAGQTPPEVFGFFFGLHRNPRPDRASYAFGPHLVPHWAVAFPAALEMMVPGSHGQVTGFEFDRTGVAKPTCAPNTAAAGDVISAVHGGALTYARLALDLRVPVARHERLLRAAVETPTMQEARRWARLRFGSLQAADATAAISLVPTLSWKGVFRLFLRPGRRLHEWPWPNAMVVQTWPRCPHWMLRMLSRKYMLLRFVQELRLRARASIRRVIHRSLSASR